MLKYVSLNIQRGHTQVNIGINTAQLENTVMNDRQVCTSERYKDQMISSRFHSVSKS